MIVKRDWLGMLSIEKEVRRDAAHFLGCKTRQKKLDNLPSKDQKLVLIIFLALPIVNKKTPNLVNNSLLKISKGFLDFIL